MNKKPATLCLSVILAGVLGATVPAARGQQATELYTPIGRSPGLSHRFTVIGTIESVDEEERSFRIAGSTEAASASLSETTRIYIDRSKLGESNQYGDFEDLEVGARVEVLYEDRDQPGEGPAEWIKVEAVGPGG